MVTRILIIGGYGNFGTHIAKRLAAEDDIQLIIGGRGAEKARAFIGTLSHATNAPEWCQMDYRTGLSETLGKVRPEIVIHTSGPFQNQGYAVASQCINSKCHYIDLADARDFVVGITELDQAARASNILVVSGASSVPCLTAAVIDQYIGQFQRLARLDYGIATAQQTNRGLATTSAVLSYAGKPFKTLIDGAMQTVFGWQDLHSRKLPEVGRRFFANCEVPDLDIFPERYPDLETIRFYAGLEVPIIQFGLWLLTWLVRCRLISRADTLAPFLLRTSRLFDTMGSDVSAFYMELTGSSEVGSEKTTKFDLTAGSGDGPFIPCAPAIIMAKKLARKECLKIGAFPCVGFIDLRSYLAELEGLDIRWQDTTIG